MYEQTLHAAQCGARPSLQVIEHRNVSRVFHSKFLAFTLSHVLWTVWSGILRVTLCLRGEGVEEWMELVDVAVPVAGRDVMLAFRSLHPTSSCQDTCRHE